MKIKDIIAYELLDSRGVPTVACRIVLEDGISFMATVSAGSSISDYSAVELRDGDVKRYNGKGVLKSVDHIQKDIAPIFVGKNISPFDFDKKLIELDGTERKERFGANTLLALSMVFFKAQAYVVKKELYEDIALVIGAEITMPEVMFNVVNGGKHAANNLTFQEYMIMPQGFSTFSDSLQATVNVYNALKELCVAKNFGAGVGDEGGLVPMFGKAGFSSRSVDDQTGLRNERAALDLVMRAIEEGGYKPGKDFVLCLDIAASTFFNTDTKRYKIGSDDLTARDMIQLYKEFIRSYPIHSIEDGLAQDEWKEWKELYKEIGDKVMIVGDDIFATNSERIKKGLQENIAHASVIKPNQIGTVSEALQAVYMCKQLKGKTIVSHRSGETTDDFIADFAVGVGSDYFKAGAPVRGERVAKYNRLLVIEKNL